MGKQRESTLGVQPPMVLRRWAREASGPGLYMFHVYMALLDQLAYVLLTLLVPLGYKICSSQEYL